MHEISIIQGHLLKIMCILHEFFEKNGLDYCLIAGSALGAARHEGFIPWDDDIDIAMPRESYNRLISISNRLPEGLFLSHYLTDESHPHGFIKIYDKNTTLIESFIRPVKRGVFIDIFPLDHGPKTMLATLLHKNLIVDFFRYLVRIKLGALKPYPRNRFKYLILSPLVIFLSAKKLSSLLDGSCSFYSESGSLGNFLSGYRSKEFFPKEVYLPTRLSKFEGINLRVPCDTSRYLDGLYGDWRKLPPVSKQKGGHDTASAILNKPYKN